jgi:hypothetical protein
MKNAWKIKIALIVVASVIAMAAIVMWLWNWLVPELFHGPEVTFWQSLGLMLLTRILFRGFFGMKGKGMHRSWGPWRERWDKMTPEERQKMRELWKKRCGGFDCSEDDKTNPPS